MSGIIAASSGAFGALELGLSELGLDWTVLAGLVFDGPTHPMTLDFIALHPRRGVALIDAVTASDQTLPPSFRMLLRSRGFERRFPGYLPIVHFRVHADEAEQLEVRLDQAFAAESVIRVTDGAWIEAMCTLLAIPPSVASPDRSSEPIVTRVVESGFGGIRGRPGSGTDYYRSWDELTETDRETVLARIESGELPKTFQVTEHRYYVGRRLPYLSPSPITRRP
jgi:hypothetical protein